MNHNLIARLNALEPEAAEKLGDALDRAETAEELLALLKAQGIDATVEDLVSKTQEEMIKVRNLGRKSLEEVEHKLNQMGLHLADDSEATT